MRLIDADDLLDDCVFSSPQFEKAMKEFISDAPTIEPEPTMSCDECPNFNKARKLIEHPERKNGKWKKSYADHEAFGVRPFFRYCSECHEATVHSYNYCPNCGADMRGEEDG